MARGARASAWISGPRREERTPRMEVPRRLSQSRSCRAASLRVSSTSWAARAARSAVVVPAATLSCAARERGWGRGQAGLLKASGPADGAGSRRSAGRGAAGRDCALARHERPAEVGDERRRLPEPPGLLRELPVERLVGREERRAVRGHLLALRRGVGGRLGGVREALAALRLRLLRRGVELLLELGALGALRAERLKQVVDGGLHLRLLLRQRALLAGAGGELLLLHGGGAGRARRVRGGLGARAAGGWRRKADARGAGSDLMLWCRTHQGFLRGCQALVLVGQPGRGVNRTEGWFSARCGLETAARLLNVLPRNVEAGHAAHKMGWQEEAKYAMPRDRAAPPDGSLEPSPLRSLRSSIFERQAEPVLERLHRLFHHGGEERRQLQPWLQWTGARKRRSERKSSTEFKRRKSHLTHCGLLSRGDARREEPPPERRQPRH